MYSWGMNAVDLMLHITDHQFNMDRGKKRTLRQLHCIHFLNCNRWHNGMEQSESLPVDTKLEAFRTW